MIEIRPYKEGDEGGFQILDRLLEIHPWNQRNLENWYWKYKGENPAGEALMFYADDNEEIIGHFAAIPMNYWISGEKVLGSHSIAMMIKPEWQNKGLIKFIADKLTAELQSKEIPFTYGYPNDNAYDLHLQMLGYEDVSMQPLFEKKIVPGAEINLHSFSSGLEFRKIDTFDEDINKLWSEGKKSFKVIVVRNRDFLNWRYFARPDIPYFVYAAYDNHKLVGYCVLKLYREDKILRGHFIDLFAIPGEMEYGRFLVQNGLEIFRDNQVNEVNLWMQGSAFFQGILKEYGFEKVSSRPMICRFNLERNTYKPLLAEDDWYFTMGDTLEIY